MSRVSPFRRPPEDEPRPGWRVWDYLFRERNPVETQEESATAQEILNWMGQAYFVQFMEYLQKNADRPVDPRLPHADLIMGTARSNTFKEIRQHLLDLKQRCHMSLGDS